MARVPRPSAPRNAVMALLLTSALGAIVYSRWGNHEPPAAPSLPDAGVPATPAPSADAPAEPPAPPERPAIVGAAHIIVTFQGAELAPPAIKRTKEQARARAEEALAKLTSGAPFEQLVAEYSEDGSKASAGMIGNFEHYAMPAPFSEAAFSLEVGQTSGVVETQRGFHIIRRIR